MVRYSNALMRRLRAVAEEVCVGIENLDDEDKLDRLRESLGAPELRSAVCRDRDGATVRVDSIVEIENVDPLARVISCDDDRLLVVFNRHIVSDECDRKLARCLIE